MDGLRQGNLIFFRECSGTPTDKKKKMFHFKGHGYGVFLGVVPEGFPMPELDFVVANMGSIGYLRIDDIKEFLGEAVLEDLLKKWQEKFTERISSSVKRMIDQKRISIVGPDGKPLGSAPAVTLLKPEGGEI